VSERSLQRLLASEGTSWKEVVDRVHLETALDLMGERSNSLADIAATLGYSEYPHFYRAFQRWTGEPPSADRKSWPLGASGGDVMVSGCPFGVRASPAASGLWS